MNDTVSHRAAIAPVSDGEAPSAICVYVVDDDEGVRYALEALIHALGWNVRSYADGASFLSDFHAQQHSCVLMDVHMPIMSGAELLGSIREGGYTGAVVMMTAHPRSPLLRDHRLELASSCLVKPFNDVQLKLAIEGALGAAEPG